jgi:CRP/FNR family cyclic AMP-dependent transcriptional regulator
MAIAHDQLASFPLFSSLGIRAQESLAARLTPRPLARGERLFDEGEPGDALYLVLTGKVKISRTAADGRENLIVLMGPGDMLGELSLFDPGPRTATATGVVNTELASLTHPDLSAWLLDQPEGAALLLRMLARRLRNSNETNSDLVFTDVPGRVAKALLELADKFGRPADGGTTWLQHGLTQEELAQLVGASRETVNKALADFAARGWLRLDGRAVLLLDRERLAQRAH